jgi:UDP-N-acetyl-alpha-D-muramoyl-L-alanyl-L-glutamate epimerase
MKFKFESYAFDKETAVVKLRYSYGEHEFVESLGFSKDLLIDYDQELLDRCLQALHIACGISYWKAFCPSEVQIVWGALTCQQADFFNEFYLQGLLQFFYENDLDPKKHSIEFKGDPSLAIPALSKFDLAAKHTKLLVPIGGGKDSLVSGALLEDAGLDFDWFCVKSDSIKKQCADISSKKLIEVTRQIAPELIRLNQQAEVYNGHVPITGILAFVEFVASCLYGYKTVVMSNEASSNQANLDWMGYQVNHQYSKTLAFENLIRDYCVQNFSTVSAGASFEYFSLLRGYSEYRIAGIFSRKCQQYFEAFSSCNRNFHFDKSKNLQDTKWCQNCEKCAFVFLLLSNFVDYEELVNIFGADLFKNTDLFEVFKQLVGLQDHKPFECVGTLEESKLALLQASKMGLLQGSLLEDLGLELSKESAIDVSELEVDAFRTNIPEELESKINFDL